jgi:hypothetical protein
MDEKDPYVPNGHSPTHELLERYPLMQLVQFKPELKQVLQGFIHD